MHKINKTAVAFLRRYATLFIKKTQYLLSRLRMNSLWRRTILNGLRLRSGHVQRKKYFKFRVCRALRSAPNAIFTGGVVAGNGSCCACSPGGAVAQRLRGFKSAEPEKTVKRSSRRTGVNLQFFPVQPTSLGLKGASSPFFVAPARRNRWHFSGSLLVSKENIPRLPPPTPCRCNCRFFSTLSVKNQPGSSAELPG